MDAPSSSARDAEPLAERIFRSGLSVSAILVCVGWALITVGNFPIIVIADSDLGSSAMERVRDASAMFLLSLAAVAVAFPLIPWSRLRIALAVVLLGLLVTHRFESERTTPAARWPSMTILGLAMVAAFADARRRRGRAVAALGILGLSVLLPFLLILTDQQGRIYLGLMPSATTRTFPEIEGMRRSIGLLGFPEGSWAESRRSGLRATGNKDGMLTVERMDGPPGSRPFITTQDYMLRVMTFSPDGKVLAVAAADSMYEGSVITLWDVNPGEGKGPPSVVLRHTLRGHTHWTFSLDFFPDGRTLVSVNGDRTARLWDTVTGQELARFTPHHHPTNCWDDGGDCVVTAPDGRTFATWGLDGIKLWNRESLQLLRVLDARGGLGCSLAFTPDGQFLFAADRETVYRWDLHPSPLLFLVLSMVTVTVVLGFFWTERTRPDGHDRAYLRTSARI